MTIDIRNEMQEYWTAVEIGLHGPEHVRRMKQDLEQQRQALSQGDGRYEVEAANSLLNKHYEIVRLQEKIDEAGLTAQMLSDAIRRQLQILGGAVVCPIRRTGEQGQTDTVPMVFEERNGQLECTPVQV